MPGMDLAQTKVPLLPPDWTAMRVATYVAKLGIFVLVPGLHQIACNRRILGGMLLLLFIVAEILQIYSPIDHANRISYNNETTYSMSLIALYFSWMLVAFDLKNLESRTLKIWILLPLFCVVWFHTPTYSLPRVVHVFVEQDGLTCPRFCNFDIVEYEPTYRDNYTLSVGDAVVIPRYKKAPFTTTILAGPPKEACAPDGSVENYLPERSYYCSKILTGDYSDDYLIYGGLYPLVRILGDKPMSKISESSVDGVRPRKIGNIRDYYFLSDDLTDLMGNFLLGIYKWTGINMFIEPSDIRGQEAGGDDHAV
jgi:hypothetical protein